MAAVLVPGAVERRVRRTRGAHATLALDAVADEVPIALEYNGTPFAVLMATPLELDELALGFSLSEGIVASPSDVRVEAVQVHLDGAVVRLRVPDAAAQQLQRRRRNLQGRSGCGLCGNASIEAVLQPPPPVADRLRIEPGALRRALDALHRRQPINTATGATHAAGWATPDGALALAHEDVGRHNALDKCIGGLHRAGIDPRTGFAVVTSRASYEMALKSARAGIELLAAISAPTSLAIALADSAGLTLIGFARDADHVVYTHPRRLDGSTAAPRARHAPEARR
ncbi:FdhD protein [Chiayiivirga flava]|uniref:Sulfur carrier protein FdhD n=2 Tax=Chiayiivirga flava TaxID=659595 RepID=A0A7W8DA26_9GAMM|nr:FdhD protein [Chiayiivirga flava]